MKLTKSRLKQIIKEELEERTGPRRTAHGLKIVGPMGCDTRVTRRGGKRDECLECVSKGKAYYPRMPAGQRCQEKDYTPDTPQRSTEPAKQVEESKNMKITKSQLKQMIEEELENVISEDGHEDVSSARRTMQTIIEDANDMLKTLENMDGTLPTWWTNKMAVAGSTLNKMRDYLLFDADQKAAEEILSTRMGSYRGTVLPGGEKVK